MPIELLETLLIYGPIVEQIYTVSVADPGIDRGGGGDFCKNLYTPQLVQPATYICSKGVQGHVRRKKLKPKASNDAF